VIAAASPTASGRPGSDRQEAESGGRNGQPVDDVVGVVGNVRFKSLDSAPTLAVYHSHVQMTWRPMAFACEPKGRPRRWSPPSAGRSPPSTASSPYITDAAADSDRSSIATPAFTPC